MRRLASVFLLVVALLAATAAAASADVGVAKGKTGGTATIHVPGGKRHPGGKKQSGGTRQSGATRCGDVCQTERYQLAVRVWEDKVYACLNTTLVGVGQDWGEVRGACVRQAGDPPGFHQAGGQLINEAPSPGQVALEASKRLVLPAATPMIGPPPEINKWQMAVVGYPLWLWTPGQHDSHAVSVSLGGVTVRLTARPIRTTFDMGEIDQHGNWAATNVVCDQTTEWSHAVVQTPPVASPTCGYTYTTPSRSKAYQRDFAYTATATRLGAGVDCDGRPDRLWQLHGQYARCASAHRR